MLARQNKCSAFSLVEVLLAITIISIIMVAMAAAIQGGLNSYEYNTSTSNVNQMARALMSRMTSQIRTALDVELMSGQNGMTITVPVPSSTDTKTVSYYLSGGQFICEDSGTPCVVLDSDDEVRVLDFEVLLLKDSDTGETLQATLSIVLQMDGTAKEIKSSSTLRIHTE
jgi:prepilin-type N-terminal cleavage/methylation domain-containing protein